MDHSEPIATSFGRIRKKGDEIAEFHWHDHRVYHAIYVCLDCGKSIEVEYMEPCPVPECEWNQQELIKNLPKISPKRALKNTFGIDMEGTR